MPEFQSGDSCATCVALSSFVYSLLLGQIHQKQSIHFRREVPDPRRCEVPDRFFQI